MISRLLLSLVIMQSILARIDMEDIKTVHETLVGEKQDVVINPRGPLNLLRGYIGNRSGHMYNKRFYSPEIDTDYALSKKGLSNRNEQEYNFKRKPVNDRVHKDMDTKTSEGKYLSMYHAQLIKMFPSADGDLSIEAGRSNALTNFLRADHVKKDTKYILAALLLLSEGVDIKINIDYKGKKNNLVIKSKTCKEKEFVNVVMHTAGIDPVTNEHSENIYQSEAAGVVKFYMQCKDNPLLKKGGEFAMPATREQFESGKFLNNAAFLIQTYIYEFIDTAEDYKNFVEAAHELLVDQVTEKENPEQTKKKGKKGRIFDELFIAKDAFDENKKYIESFCDLIQAKNGSTNFPFLDSSQLPKYTRVPRCKLDKSGFEKDQALYYSNCVETALLGLFCCLAYNQKTGKYETSHMGEGVSDELRDFFGDYPKPTETTDFEMHKKWSSVVACLKDEKIKYLQSRNELFPGVGNIFLVIAEITGQKADILELVECIENACRTGKLDNKQKEYISNKIESIIKALSKNKNVRVVCKKMRLEMRSDDKADILAEINIIYTFGKAYNGISLDIIQGHANLALLPSSNTSSTYVKERYEEVKNIYSGINCYIGYIADQYVSAELDALSFNDYNLRERLKKKVAPIMDEGPEGISKIFLLGRLVCEEVKSTIIMRFIFCTVDKEVGPTNPLARFTANLLGSVPLNDYASRQPMMMFFPFHASWQKFYPRLGFKPSEPIPKKDRIWTCLTERKEWVCNTILRPLSAPATLKAICNYLRAIVNDPRMIDLSVQLITRATLIYRIMYSGGIEDLVEIQSNIKEYMKDHNLNYVYIIWFMYVCSGHYKFSLESAKTVYDFIVFDDYPNPLEFKEAMSGPSEYFKKSVILLDENKALFCSEDDRKSMEKYDAVLEYYLGSRWSHKKRKSSCCTIS
ncbi:uncharacterized protein NESG_02468 [Nematocida ausubeli]|uniref:Uncharacterized protein n=1 Tax=Nematocida ausubeli (strain ATCC PRA-371 / ERTm2) TaxID=1913371 RepID=A0A086IYX1_NEMA1|nr:uncharacterized protein NESG_02468 [Nematocida ausubeli]KFG25089.1 hypothetical protein NESG_02468 [Nematocida ausubeli]